MTSDATTTRSSTSRSRGPNGGDPGGNAEAVQAAVREVRSALQGVGRSMPEVVPEASETASLRTTTYGAFAGPAASVPAATVPPMIRNSRRVSCPRAIPVLSAAMSIHLT